MKIIFISRPTTINDDFESSYTFFHNFLIDQGYTLKRLGGGTYSKAAPLKAVINLIHECCGTIILGYPQYEFIHKAARSKLYFIHLPLHIIVPHLTLKQF